MSDVKSGTIFLLIKPKISPQYNHAIHTIVFLMLDNKPHFKWDKGTSVGAFLDKNKEKLNIIASFIKEEYLYEISHQQLAFAVYSFMYFQSH